MSSLLQIVLCRVGRFRTGKFPCNKKARPREEQVERSVAPGRPLQTTLTKAGPYRVKCIPSHSMYCTSGSGPLVKDSSCKAIQFKCSVHPSFCVYSCSHRAVLGKDMQLGVRSCIGNWHYQQVQIEGAEAAPCWHFLVVSIVGPRNFNVQSVCRAGHENLGRLGK